MIDSLTKMTKEEKIISYEIRAKEEIDPRFRERVQHHFIVTREQLKAALDNVSISPESVELLDARVRMYGKILSVAVKMDVAEMGKDDAFAEANKTAQEQEAEKLS
jgi:hypothetical protein